MKRAIFILIFLLALLVLNACMQLPELNNPVDPNNYLSSPCPGMPTIADPRDGKIYNTVLIGEQCWLKENLDLGTRIDGSQDQTNNGVIEKYCYNDNIINCETYGGLYQWDEAMLYATVEGAQGICPSGWHIPAKTEFETLKAVVKSDGNSLKEIGQGHGGGAGTNTSGFSALLAGYRVSGDFGSLGLDTYFWSSTEYDANNAYYSSLYASDSGIYFNYGYYKESVGFSVRCVKD